MDKIIFLDIDGVLCHNGRLTINGESVKMGFHKDKNNKELFYENAVSNLKLILEAHPTCKIYLMSCWAILFDDADHFNRLLEERGIPPICIDLMRKSTGQGGRGITLSRWMDEKYKPNFEYTENGTRIVDSGVSYVILDDSYACDYQYKHKDNIVEVLTHKCLTYENALKAIEILSKESYVW